MFNTGSRPTITKSVIESADSGLESADSSPDCNTDLAKVGVWARAKARVESGCRFSNPWVFP